MFEIVAQQSPIHLAYLALVITAFMAFGASLAFVHIWSNLPVRRAVAPARADAAEQPIEYANAA